jgi:hypothetical protein
LEEERDVIDRNEYTVSGYSMGTVKKNDTSGFWDLNGV